jgi:hypothetical protein
MNLQKYNDFPKTSRGLENFLSTVHYPQMAYNDPAAWRRRGFLALTFGRATASLAPNRTLAAGILGSL